MLITTNGESTERTYFDALKREPWISAKVAVAVERGSPTDLVRGTGRRQRDNDYDEAWAVCDVDHYPPEEASAEAQRSGVRLAWSNPCFEVWLLLHLCHHAGYVENAKKARDLLRKHLPHWDKTLLDFDSFRSGVPDACRRAARLDPPPAGNPSTSVGELVAALQR
ncbi:RloB family protein [Verrucosispora sp. WMMD703]|uniref:RloB family protein n=1 Tax=unclassified Micromonospora TaxID=2617518 RepID=UPI00249AE917|nr:RloB family protein [Verrucosispora sp. WMMD1129]WFE47326.1 RloB family protein [Verrucosispora sp. WMMD1129]